MTKHITGLVVVEELDYYDGLLAGFAETDDGRVLLFDMADGYDARDDRERRYNLYESWREEPRIDGGVETTWTVGVGEPVGWCAERELLETIPGPCASCSHDPACGFASVSDNNGVRWLCHADDHSCYEP